MAATHKSRSMFDRYDITDERDIQIAGQKLARYLEEKGKAVINAAATDTINESNAAREAKRGKVVTEVVTIDTPASPRSH